MPHSDEQNRWKESKASTHQTRFLSLRCQTILWIAAIIVLILSCVFLFYYFGIKL